MFECASFSNSASYLLYDVKILLECTKILRENYHRYFGVDFLVARAFTVSSLASYSAQISLATRHKVGNFLVNSPQKYKASSQASLFRVFR